MATILFLIIMFVLLGGSIQPGMYPGKGKFGHTAWTGIIGLAFIVWIAWLLWGK